VIIRRILCSRCPSWVSRPCFRILGDTPVRCLRAEGHSGPCAGRCEGCFATMQLELPWGRCA
jgi:hypothetical protein